ncbi:MAG: hypothetical protein PWP51_2570 [Clostridiales bacterium]|nr:hypothetical protein [Clostridiales bacterium]
MFADVALKYKKKNKMLFSRDSQCLQTLVALIQLQNHRVLVMWALDCAKQTLETFETKYPDEKRPRICLTLCESWAKGEIKMPIAKRAILDSHAVAKELNDRAYESMCHAIGHAGTTVHVETHALGLPIYELTAFVFKYGIDNFQKPVTDKINYYYDRLLYWQDNTDDLDINWAEFLSNEKRLNKEKLLNEKRKWLNEWRSEAAFAFKGWDFSHLDGRWESESLPWDYRTIVRSVLKQTDQLLDMGTGGGEFLLTLGHPYVLTTATEAYAPNVDYCLRHLAPRGIQIVQTYEDDKLPFEDSHFDIIINRHESFDAAEVCRVLKTGGYFITQQVGGENNRDLSQRLIEAYVPSFPQHTLSNNSTMLQDAGFHILQSDEVFTPIRFFDVGALVYFAKIITWEFPDFSVDDAFEKLCQCQREIEAKGYIQGTEHRFVIVAQKL